MELYHQITYLLSIYQAKVNYLLIFLCDVKKIGYQHFLRLTAHNSFYLKILSG